MAKSSNVSADRLAAFLQEHYIDDESIGSPNMETAVRDLFTDALHVLDDLPAAPSADDLLENAWKVFDEEKG